MASFLALLCAATSVTTTPICDPTPLPPVDGWIEYPCVDHVKGPAYSQRDLVTEKGVPLYDAAGPVAYCKAICLADDKCVGFHYHNQNHTHEVGVWYYDPTTFVNPNLQNGTGGLLMERVMTVPVTTMPAAQETTAPTDVPHTPAPTACDPTPLPAVDGWIEYPCVDHVKSVTYSQVDLISNGVPLYDDAGPVAYCKAVCLSDDKCVGFHYHKQVNENKTNEVGAWYHDPETFVNPNLQNGTGGLLMECVMTVPVTTMPAAQETTAPTDVPHTPAPLTSPPVTLPPDTATPTLPPTDMPLTVSPTASPTTSASTVAPPGTDAPHTTAPATITPATTAPATQPPALPTDAPSMSETTSPDTTTPTLSPTYMPLTASPTASPTSAPTVAPPGTAPHTTAPATSVPATQPPALPTGTPSMSETTSPDTTTPTPPGTDAPAPATQPPPHTDLPSGETAAPGATTPPVHDSFYDKPVSGPTFLTRSSSLRTLAARPGVCGVLYAIGGEALYTLHADAQNASLASTVPLQGACAGLTFSANGTYGVTQCGASLQVISFGAGPPRLLSSGLTSSEAILSWTQADMTVFAVVNTQQTAVLMMWTLEAHHMREVGTIEVHHSLSPDAVVCLSVSGGTLYASIGSTLVVVNVSTIPEYVSSQTFPHSFTSLHASGHQLLATTDTGSLITLQTNTTDKPPTLRESGHIAASGQLIVQDGVYILGPDSISVVGITDGVPSVIYKLETASPTVGLIEDRGVLYVATTAGALLQFKDRAERVTKCNTVGGDDGGGGGGGDSGPAPLMIMGGVFVALCLLTGAIFMLLWYNSKRLAQHQKADALISDTDSREGNTEMVMK